MSKTFQSGLTYVFTAKKFLQWSRKKYNCFKFRTWHKQINGRKVTIRNENNGFIDDFDVIPEWCKCIKGGNING